MAAMASVEELAPAWLPLTLRDPVSWALLAAAGLLLLLLRWQLGRSPPQGLPPGPKPWPLVGNFAFAFFPTALARMSAGKMSPFEDAAPSIVSMRPIPLHLVLSGMARMYGSIFCLLLGRRPIVVLSDLEAVREALVNQAEIFSDRPTAPIVHLITKKKGKPRGSCKKNQKSGPPAD